MHAEGTGGSMRTSRRVGITQRPMVLPERDETRDALDVRLARLVWDLGFAPVPIVNAIADTQPADASPADAQSADAPLDYLEALGLHAIVLSGGDDVGDPPARDRIERAALALAERDGLPVLGICRGLQLLNVVGGGTLTPIDGHVATRHMVEGPRVARREVNSFHRLAIAPDGLAADLEATASAPDGTIEAVQHRHLPWTGIMWHPERERPFADADLGLVADALAGARP